MSKEIQFTNSDLVAIVDDADYEFLNQFTWYAKLSDGSNDLYHAVRNVTLNDKNITIRMHRLITEARHDQHVYHIDGDTLNNRRSNLQLRTLNPWTGRPLDAGFRGVHQVSNNKWRAEVLFAGRMYNLGNEFETAQDAAMMYDTAVRKLYGNNAITNF